MELIKRKILLEQGKSRTPDLSYGTMTASSFYIKIMISQDWDDMGSQSLDMPFIKADGSTPDYTPLIEELTVSGITFPFMLGITPTFPVTGDTGIRHASYSYGNYSGDSGTLTGLTNDKLYDVTSYNAQNPLIPNFDIVFGDYINYKGELIDGRTRVISNGEPKIYAIDGENDSNIGTPNQTSGILYKTLTSSTRTVNIENIGQQSIPVTDFQIQGEGWNETNTTLSASTMDEYLFGITSAPEVQSDVLIERGVTTVMEMHLRMSEIESLEHLAEYGNGFYKIRKI